jgi:hypothetical protein
MNTIDELRQELNNAATSLRLGQDGAGNDAMVRFTDLLWCHLSSGAVVAPIASLNRILPELIAAQERGDSLWIADLLEHELLLILEEKS